MATEHGVVGDANFICDISGFKGKISDSVLQWNGLRVLKRFADVRNPQDFPVRIRENPAVPDPRPEGADVYQVGLVHPSDL